MNTNQLISNVARFDEKKSMLIRKISLSWLFFFFALSTVFAQAGNGNTLLILQTNTHGNDNGGAGGFAKSLVELYNNSDTDINLTAGNYYLHIGNSTTWTNVIKLSGTIPARSSFLVVSSNPAGNSTPRALLPEADQEADFVLVNDGFKVALMRNRSALLSVANPFGDAELSGDYVDMLGVEGSNAFETNPASQSRPQPPRRISLVDTDDNAADFRQIDLRGELLGNNRTPDNALYRFWPRNSTAGAWNPISGEPAIHPTPYPHLIVEPKAPILPGTPDELAGKLLILQAYGSAHDANGTTHSFIELYNTTDEPINLSGITLFHADGTDFRNFTPEQMMVLTGDSPWRPIPLHGMIPPQTSFLVLGQKQNHNEPVGAPNSSGNRPSHAIQDNSGDINANFTLSNRAFKVALIRNSGDLTVQNPFTMDGDGRTAQGYIDMVGARNTAGRDTIFGFEVAPARNSASQSVRRISLIDTNNNRDDFATTDIRTSQENWEIIRPKNRAFGAWNPMTGERSSQPTATGTLPVIFIDTYGAEIHHSSAGIWTPMTFSLIDPNNPENNISAMINQEVRGRGNSTWNTPKRPYRIRFRDDQQQSLFGLPPARNWVLLANFFDVTLLKTSYAFELGKRLGLPYTPSYHHVELYLDGVFQGSYLLTEHRQADPAGIGAPGRPKVHPTEGWFVEMDRHPDEPSFWTTNYNLPFEIRSPDFGANINDERYSFVKNDWRELTDLMISESFPENGYRDLIDMETFIKFFLVRLITREGDWEIPGSNFFYRRDRDGKISAGPLWDFDLSFGFRWDNVPLYKIGAGQTNWVYPGHPFFARFLQDPVFRVRWKEIWNENFDDIYSMSQFIDDMADKIRKSAEENFKIWWTANHSYGTNWWSSSLPHGVDYGYWIREMRSFSEIRIAHLNEVYNRVNILPQNTDFGTIHYNDYPETLSSQTFTLVSYGEISGLTAILRRGNSSNFEIVAGLTQTPTGNGGYLTTIGIKPKSTLSPGIYTDVLELRGSNQGNSFSIDVPLRLEITTELSAWVRDGVLHITGLNPDEKVRVFTVTGVLIYQAKAISDIMDIPLSTRGLYIIQNGSNALKVIN